MKIIQLSDLHLTRPGVALAGRDPHACLSRVIDHVNAHHADADLVVLTGDLANDGEEAAYAALAPELARLLPPWRATLGNHDDRGRFLARFPGQADATGHAQGVMNLGADLGAGVAIVLDTLDPGQVAGRLCAARRDWFGAALAAARGREVALFLHHPPMPIGAPALDAVRLEPDSAAAVARLCLAHGGVRLIGAGHVHRPAAGVWRGLPFVTVRGTCIQSALLFEDRFALSDDPFGYAIHLWHDGDRVSHVMDLGGAAAP